jgi:hypothetical protein
MDRDSARVLADRYEELRNLALAGGEGRGGLGLALFLGRGMAAWIDAWERCPRSPSPVPRPTTAPVGPTTVLAPGLQTEVALVLAGMAMSGQEEVTS